MSTHLDPYTLQEDEVYMRRKTNLMDAFLYTDAEI